MTSENTHWEVYVVEFARSKQQPWVDLVAGMYDDGKVDLPFSFVLLRHGDRNVLVDTGFIQETSTAFSLKFDIPHWISPVRMLAELGSCSRRDHRHFCDPCAFRSHGIDRRVPECKSLYPEKRIAVLV
ncbi:hypothetical protein [Mesorhizobium sp. M0965]|uniref:hypothetical protein n=1 Tax=Mesorhizobium sp. M0965 TaxID=2957036 RepID=UPI00333CF233